MQRLALLLLLVFAAPAGPLFADVAALVQEYTEARGDEEKIVAIEYAATVGRVAVEKGEEEVAVGIANLLGTAMCDESPLVQIRAVQLAGYGGAIEDLILRHGTVDTRRQVLASLPVYEKWHCSAPEEILPAKKWSSWFKKVGDLLPSSVAKSKETAQAPAGK